MVILQASTITTMKAEARTKTMEMTLMRVGPTANLACHHSRMALERRPFLKIQEGRRTEMMLPHLHMFADLFADGVDVESLKAKLLQGVKTTAPWRKTLQLHPLSTPCSRFLDDIPEWTATDQNQYATSVVQARCEVASRGICFPSDMRLSPAGNILAVSSMGGWKNRVPYLHYYLPTEETGAGSINSNAIKVDLMSGLREMLIDDERRLLFASDWDRVRSYRCKEPNVPRDEPAGRALRVHTLSSKGYSGPLAGVWQRPEKEKLRSGTWILFKLTG
ncbi:hypothetical protein HYPSUDRAFT_611421 [Hypholoma sublateritium FD-334 SS-4]|uniref:Uncharacterized protein n=1 Tax=Hypholoma sublateritium (strain FD-334 SS-4) TaxID=945553 RepID=A0A0D2PT74_HYPSF|nr:hypothetical protein HYPSUDRAFT_611421 [Hypholoma sublateritium FD-334 SS-4]